MFFVPLRKSFANVILMGLYPNTYRKSKRTMEYMEKIMNMAEQCLTLELEERPEITWLKDKYARLQEKYHLNFKEKTDCFIFERMYLRPPKNSYETLKIRYWRTGKHVPSDRQQCTSFGKALELSDSEMELLIKEYYDRNDQAFEKVPDKSHRLYWERKKLIDALVTEYLDRVSENHLQKLNIPISEKEHYLRHLYYIDALKYVNCNLPDNQLYALKHTASINYGSELQKNLKLLGEVSRKSMLRHLLILKMPYISREIINSYLLALGYCPLCEQHTLTGGERLDWLLLHLLELYEEYSIGKSPDECIQWFQMHCSLLDRYFAEHGKKNLRFHYFKALEWIS